jgi:hypothetical protein
MNAPGIFAPAAYAAPFFTRSLRRLLPPSHSAVYRRRPYPGARCFLRIPFSAYPSPRRNQRADGTGTYSNSEKRRPKEGGRKRGGVGGSDKREGEPAAINAALP